MSSTFFEPQGIYNILPEDELSGSKHVEDITNSKLKH